MCEKLEDFVSITMGRTDLYVDTKPSRVKRDIYDVNKVVKWFLLPDAFPEVSKVHWQ